MTKPRFYRYDVCRHVDLYFCGRYFCNYGRHLYGFVATIAATFTIATTVAITVVPTATTTAIFVKAFLFEGNGRSGIFYRNRICWIFRYCFNNNAAKSVAEYFSNNASADSRYLSKPFSSRSLSMVSTAALNCP